MLKAVKKAEDKELLTQWFVKDDNQVPAQFQLQSIREKLKHYADDEQPDKRKQACAVSPLYLFLTCTV